MLTVFHQQFSPFCRKIRLIIAEKGLELSLEAEKPWARRPEFLALNPAGEVPVLIDDDGTVVADSGAIAEYLEERYPEPALMGPDSARRAEVRRLTAWFDLKFDREVTRPLAYEKLLKSQAGRGGPDSERMRAGRANIGYHLDYIGFLAERRRWLAGDTLSLADLAAAAHLSVLDYVGEVPWSRHEDAKDWYARLKSRPSFRALLAERMVGIPPAACYANLDF